MELIIEYFENATLKCRYEKTLIEDCYFIVQGDYEETIYTDEEMIHNIFNYEELYKIKRIIKADEHFKEVVENANIKEKEYRNIILYLLNNIENKYTLIETYNPALCILEHNIVNNELYEIWKIKTVDFETLEEKIQYGILDFLNHNDYKTIFQPEATLKELINSEIKNCTDAIKDIESYVKHKEYKSQKDLEEAQYHIFRYKQKIDFLQIDTSINSN